MNCFNHTEQPAVAQCSSCGKFLCKECATNYQSSFLCKECVASIHQEQYVEQQKAEMSEKNLLVLAIVLFAVNFMVYFIGGIVSGTLTFGNLLFNLISSIMWAGVPYGWRKLNGLKDKLSFILILPLVGWLIYFGIKVTIARLIGWYFLLKRIIKK